MPRHRLSEDQRRRMKESQLARCRNPRLADVVERNICTILEIRNEHERSKNRQDRIADLITAFSGSMLFAYLHVVWFGLWIAINLGWLGVKPFDPFPFGLLTMVVSLEAIFLSTFVLISQNRMALVSDQRADLDLQINLLTEHETTRILTLVHAMARQMAIPEANDPEVIELEQDVAPEVVVEEMEERAHERGEQRAGKRATRQTER